MNQKYEGLLILSVKGNEENAKELTEKLEGDFKKEGANVEQVQKIGNRHFSYAPGHEDNGYYVNFIFQAEAPTIAKLQARFKLNSGVYRQYFKKLTVTAPREPREPRAAK